MLYTTLILDISSLVNNKIIINLVLTLIMYVINYWPIATGKKQKLSILHYVCSIYYYC